MISDTAAERYASLLLNAEAKRMPIDPFSASDPAFLPEDAYRIQDRIASEHIRRGEMPIGYKVGMTTKPIQKLFGSDEPDYGVLFDANEIHGGVVETAELIQPKVEGEIAFVLREDLFGTTYTGEDILRVTEYAFPAIEIVDCRIKDWTFRIQDTIADSAACGRFLLTERRPYSGADLRNVRLRAYKNDVFLAEGAGCDVLGNPADSVAWLANKLGSRGLALRKGMVILSGSLVGMHPASSGDQFRFDYDCFGSVSVRFA